MSLKAYRSTGRTHARGVSLASLMAKVDFSASTHAKCVATKRDGTPCGHWAMRDTGGLCRYHGGYGALALQGKYRSQGRGKGDPETLNAPSALRALPVWGSARTGKQRRALIAAYLARGEAPDAWRKALSDASD